jgi:hypothetical protein
MRIDDWLDHVFSIIPVWSVAPLTATNLTRGVIAGGWPLSIDYMGHCAYSIEDAHTRIAHLRRTRREWYRDVLQLADAHGLGPFGHEIALEFGIDAKCQFGLYVLNKDRLDEAREAVEYVYEVFGTDYLVITYGTDSIRPPLRPYPPMKVAPLI